MVFRPFEHLLATALSLPDVGDRFLSRLLPGISSPGTSEDISSALRRDTSRFLGSGIGIRDWRQITVGFSDAHRNPHTIEIRNIDPDNQIRGHTNEVANAHYGNTLEDPAGVGLATLQKQLQVAHWWFHLVGVLMFLISNASPLKNDFYRYPKW